MSNYGKILQQFTKLGHNENTNFTEQSMKRALNDICNKNTGIRQFSSQVAEELWQEAEKNSDDTVTLKNYIDIVTRAQGILKENIQKCQTELALDHTDHERKLQLQEGLLQYNDDLKLLTLPFQIAAQPESKYMKESKQRMQESRASGKMDASGLFSGRASGIFADVPSARENSTSLKLTFLITVILFTLQLVLMFHKNHFYNALVYLSIFAIIILGYFDKHYIKFVLVNLLASIIFDFLWVILQASPYWNPNPPTHHSTIQTPFLRFMFLFVIFLMIAKVLLLLLFFRYRNNDETVRKSVALLGSTFEIDGKLKDNNPISRILAGKAAQPVEY